MEYEMVESKVPGVYVEIPVKKYETKTMKPPPPIPAENMLTVPMQRQEAMAASTAFPPSLSTI